MWSRVATILRLGSPRPTVYDNDWSDYDNDWSVYDNDWSVYDKDWSEIQNMLLQRQSMISICREACLTYCLLLLLLFFVFGSIV